MINAIRIRNFQRHKDKSLHFNSNVTAITGYSDTGKSSALRAFRWLCLNKPRGFSFRTNGSKKTKVLAQVDEKLSVRRLRSNIENTYAINEKGRIQKSASVGSEVPEDVQKLLRVGEENFQGQHDPPFWFNLTAGELVKKLNQIVNLEVMDAIVGDITKRVRDNKSKKLLVEERIDKFEKEVRSYNFVDDVDMEYRALQEQFSEYFDLSEKVEQGTYLLDDIQGLWKKSRNLKACVNDAGTVLEFMEQLDHKEKDVANLSKLMEQVEELDEVISRGIPDIEPLRVILVDLENKEVEAEDLLNCLSSARRHKLAWEQAKEAWNRAKKKLGDVKVCPTCGSVIG